MPLPIPQVPFLLAAFGSPLMLWGLAGASLPIIIHLLNRRKFREMRWAAMRFLLSAIRKNQRRVRIEQWILLAVRTLLLLFLALAMAKPALESLGALGALGGRRHWVLALDGSLSMSHVAGGSSRFDQAREIARRLVKDARNGDAFSVVLLSDPPRTLIGAPAFAKDAVTKAIDDVKLPHGSLDLAGGFMAVDAALEASDINQKELVVLTDLQSTSWKSSGAGAEERLRRALSRMEAKRVRSLVIDLGGDGANNRAVVSLSVEPKVVTVGAPTTIRARVQAFGAPYTAGRARFVVDGRAIPSEEQQIRPLAIGELVELEFHHEFSSAGDHVVEVRIDDDALVLDNRRRQVVSAREAVDVLFVDGDPKPGLFESEVSFFAEAVAPEAESPGQTSPFRIRTITESQLARTELSAFDVLVLANVPRVTRAESEALEAYLRIGGGVVVFTGDLVQPASYNRMLYNSGRGLLPAEIGAAVGDPKSRENPYLFDTMGFQHPIVSDFLGQPDSVLASLTLVKTFRYHRLTLPRDSAARVALKVGNDPLVVDADRGRGRVVLVATTVDRDWTDWPVHKSYPSVMTQVVLQAASGRFVDRSLAVGQPVEELLPASAAGVEATLTWPDRDEGLRASDVRVSRLKVEPAGDVSLVKSAPTEFSGTYRLDLGAPLSRVRRFSANPNPAESDLAKLDRAGLNAAVPGWSFEYASDWQPLIASTTAVHSRGELHRSLLWAVLLFVLVESVLAWKFGHHTTARS
jgi:hypothetical protein